MEMCRFLLMMKRGNPALFFSCKLGSGLGVDTTLGMMMRGNLSPMDGWMDGREGKGREGHQPSDMGHWRVVLLQGERETLQQLSTYNKP